MEWREKFLSVNAEHNRPDTSALDNAIRTISRRFFDIEKSNLMTSDESKIVVKKEMPPGQKYLLVQKKVIEPYENYLFQFQSLISGRKSKNITRDLMDVLGITAKALETGGLFPDAFSFENNIEKVRNYYIEQMYVFINRRRDLLIDYYNSFGSSNSIWWEIYTEYLQSKEWRNKRDERLIYDLYLCQLCACDDESILQVHHETYKNVGDEDINDLLTVCKPCHQQIHGREF